MSNVLRRSMANLAAAGPSKLPPHVGSAAATAPIAVRVRRAKYPGSSKLATSPITEPSLLGPTIKGSKSAKLLPPPLEAEFQALRAKGQYKGDEASGRKAFLLGQVAWRSRVRGVKENKLEFWRDMAAKREARLSGAQDAEEGAMADELDGEEGADMGEVDPAAYGDFPAGSSTSKQVVGKKIYLPNLQIRLVRNHTPPGEAYDPYVATFRIPLSMTKTDLRSYLSAVYNLPVTFIRTSTYLGEVYRTQQNKISRKGGFENNYKKAIVGLLEPFHYPDDLGELEAQGQAAGVGDKWAKERRDWLEKYFYQQTSVDQRKKGLSKRIQGAGRAAAGTGTAADKARVKAAVKQDYEDRIEREMAKLSVA